MNYKYQFTEKFNREWYYLQGYRYQVEINKTNEYIAKIRFSDIELISPKFNQEKEAEEFIFKAGIEVLNNLELRRNELYNKERECLIKEYKKYYEKVETNKELASKISEISQASANGADFLTIKQKKEELKDFFAKITKNTDLLNNNQDRDNLIMKDNHSERSNLLVENNLLIKNDFNRNNLIINDNLDKIKKLKIEENNFNKNIEIMDKDINNLFINENISTNNELKDNDHLDDNNNELKDNSFNNNNIFINNNHLKNNNFINNKQLDMNNQLNNNNVNDNQLDHNNELNEILKLKKELNELYKNDKSYLENVKKIDLNDKNYQIILIKICSYYDLIPPAYETIRENDVYLTTGMFYDIKFTSTYSYDLNQSKEEVSKSIFEYIENNWNEILEESNKRREGLFK